MKIFVFCACSFLCVQRKNSPFDTKTSIKVPNVVRSFTRIETNDEMEKMHAFSCLPCIFSYVFLLFAEVCVCVCVREFVRSSFVWSVCCFFFLFNFVQSCCTIWLYYFCSAHNLLDVAAAAFGKYYVEVIERQRPKLWLAKVTDRQTDGRTDKRAYRLTKLTWLSCQLLCIMLVGFA